MVCLNQLLGTDNQGFAEAQAAADGKGVAGTWYADKQPVGWPQCCYIKFHTGIFDALTAKGKGLQLRIMGSGHHRGLDGQQPLQNGHSQGGTLLRIRTCSQLIQQQQILRLHLIQNLYQMGHMGRKGTKALLNALLVSDISIDIAINSNLRAGLCRQKQAGLSH